ncbi:class I SAM-dependent methyltransferase [Christiangramia crocea]|uniref:Class I SAM-dependent methyltransferase n=1 Tax=Christiangramia crocea TaxID=2904124 RepID=A0A9X1UZD3_9FLAO|nr:class I SAM-dependent methyltransferase [Gramella crocea]MCG9973011.1 class I SAM-dependent methyltransferase [Gramella crocea]
MNRFQLMKHLIEEKNYSTYVEIGVHRGRLFFPLKCKRKIAVDPAMKINWKGKLVWIKRNFFNINNRYFEITSDEFFKRKAPSLFKQDGVDLFFIDGLHTFEASLKDVLNSLRYLNKNGTIVMHDCVPPNKAAATPASSFHEAKDKNIKGWTGQWCGDVWKTMEYLKIKYPESLEISVMEDDFGLGIINPAKELKHLIVDEKLFERIDRMKYEAFLERKTVKNNIA